MSNRKAIKVNTDVRTRYFLAAAFLVLLIFILAFLSVDNSCYWGDDYAAYLSQGIAMAEGRLEEQAKLNIKMHPSPLFSEALEDGELTYVWGYPLILSLIYRIVGFDRVNYSSIIYYKLPSVFALSLLAAVLFFFYRRRLGAKLSFVLALLFCCCAEMFDFLNSLYSDMVFLFLAMLSLLLCEIYLERKKSLIGFLLGICLWFMYEVRLNGISILLCCILATAFYLLENRKQIKIAHFAKILLPYILFLLLLLFSNFLIGSATPNTSDIGSGMDAEAFLSNLKSYAKLICHWFGLLWNSILINPLYSVLRRFTALSFDSFTPLRNILVYATAVLFILGLIFEGKGKNFHLSVLVVVYIITASALPYTQGLRYIYPLLPLILMFVGCTFAKAARLFKKLPHRIYFAGSLILALLCCLFIVYPHMSAAYTGDKGVNVLEEISSASDIYMQNAYSQDAVELYRYIQENTETDCTIAFFAPRALYLNTQRVAVRPGVNGHSIDEADYYLQYLSVGDYPVDTPPDLGFTRCFENNEFVLYVKDRK